MNTSFAQYRFALPATVLLVAITLAGCATLPPPTAELSTAQQSVARATAADGDQYAAQAMAQARSELSQAQAAMAAGDDDSARALALQAAADADFTTASSQAARTRADYAQRRAEVADLQQRLQLPADLPASSPLDAAAADPAQPVDPAMRLQAVDADPQLNAFAAYERLRAHQALDAALAIRSTKQRDAAMPQVARRVAIAELAARTEATRQRIDQLDRQRSELLVEASRQEAERARQEAERMRMQAQLQAEEAQRLREAADAEAAARQQAEDVVNDVGAQAAARLKAARARDAELARQEAELTAGEAADKARDKPAPAKPKPRHKPGR